MTTGKQLALTMLLAAFALASAMADNMDMMEMPAEMGMDPVTSMEGVGVGADLKDSYDYCIIGAGPAGVQLARHMSEAGRDFVVLEKGYGAAHYYTSMPRHRKLISVNKVATGRGNPEFNMRHDWNSVLPGKEDFLFTKYTKAFFPKADIYVKYLRDYVVAHNLQPYMRYRTLVKAVVPVPPTKKGEEQSYKLSVASAEDEMSDKRELACKRVVVATGWSKPNVPPMQGIEHAVGYESVSTNPMDFFNKTVMILGGGNSGFETADWISGHTAYIHVAAGSRMKLSWETHYVGDLRGLNNNLLDTYQLKSLDGFTTVGNMTNIKLEKLDDGRILVSPLNITEANRPENYYLRHPYDVVIRALGFSFDQSIFPGGKHPGAKRNKFPLMTPEFESAALPNLYFAGTLQHLHDYRKAAGGFIHGFRYLVRALHNIMEEKYESKPWAMRDQIDMSVDGITNWVMNRGRTTSALYQMPGALTDVVLLPSPFQLRKDMSRADIRAGKAEPCKKSAKKYADAMTADFANPREFVADDEAVLEVDGKKTVALREVPVKLLWQWGMRHSDLPPSKMAPLRRYAKSCCSYNLAAPLACKNKSMDKSGLFPLPDPASKADAVFTADGRSKYGAPALTHSLEYGRHFSGAGKDTFRPNRSNDKLKDAHRSNFLHPVLRFYPLGLGHRPALTYHVLEDFYSEWDLPQTHEEPLRQWLSDVVMPYLKKLSELPEEKWEALVEGKLAEMDATTMASDAMNADAMMDADADSDSQLDNVDGPSSYVQVHCTDLHKLREGRRHPTVAKSLYSALNAAGADLKLMVQGEAEPAEAMM